MSKTLSPPPPLQAREVYSFLALAAFYSQYYRWCSKAFIKLESLPVRASHVLVVRHSFPIHPSSRNFSRT